MMTTKKTRESSIMVQWLTDLITSLRQEQNLIIFPLKPWKQTILRRMGEGRGGANKGERQAHLIAPLPLPHSLLSRPSPQDGARA